MAATQRVREQRATRSMTQQEQDKVQGHSPTVAAIKLDKDSPSVEAAFCIAHVFAGPLHRAFQFDPPGQEKQ